MTSTGSIPSLQNGEFHPTRRTLPPYTTSPLQNHRRIHEARTPRAYFSVHTIIVGGSTDAIEYEPVRSPRGKSLLFFPSFSSHSPSLVLHLHEAKLFLLRSLHLPNVSIIPFFLHVKDRSKSLPPHPSLPHPEISSALSGFLCHAQPVDMSVVMSRGNLISFRTNSS